MTKRRAARGFTLLELLVAVAVLAFITMLIYGAFSSMKRTRDGLARVQDRYREGRVALGRIVRDLESAYISGHQPFNQGIVVQKTAFIGHEGNPGDRLDFNAFSNVRRDRDSHVSDQIEVSYFSAESLEESGTTDLVRRTSEYPDEKPEAGGRIDVVATDIDLFDLEYLDPTTTQWVDTWDTTQATGQPNRLPLQVRITLVLNGGSKSAADRSRGTLRFATTVMLPMQQALGFATQ
ncbi:MAG TPA: type II secretion system protein GspJ [Polyangiaceae bacterium]